MFIYTVSGGFIDTRYAGKNRAPCGLINSHCGQNIDLFISKEVLNRLTNVFERIS
jgi:hypothetical protein